jgi:hypothetical protein
VKKASLLRLLPTKTKVIIKIEITSSAMLIQFSCLFFWRRETFDGFGPNVLSLPPWKCQYGFNRCAALFLRVPLLGIIIIGRESLSGTVAPYTGTGRVSTNWIDTERSSSAFFTDSCFTNRLLSVMPGARAAGSSLGRHAESVTTREPHQNRLTDKSRQGFQTLTAISWMTAITQSGQE